MLRTLKRLCDYNIHFGRLQTSPTLRQGTRTSRLTTTATLTRLVQVGLLSFIIGFL